MTRGVYERTPERVVELARSLDLIRWGVTNPRWAGDSPSRQTAHKRVVAVRGRAATHSCEDCGEQAKDWSYAEPVGWSTNPDDYTPRCRSCHKRYDRRLLVEGYLRDSEERQA